MSDLVERLRATGGKGQGGPIKAEAADEIERLTALLDLAAVAFVECEKATWHEGSGIPRVNATVRHVVQGFLSVAKRRGLDFESGAYSPNAIASLGKKKGPGSVDTDPEASLCGGP